MQYLPQAKRDVERLASSTYQCAVLASYPVILYVSGADFHLGSHRHTVCPN